VRQTDVKLVARARRERGCEERHEDKPPKWRKRKRINAELERERERKGRLREAERCTSRVLIPRRRTPVISSLSETTDAHFNSKLMRKERKTYLFACALDTMHHEILFGKTAFSSKTISRNNVSPVILDAINSIAVRNFYGGDRCMLPRVFKYRKYTICCRRRMLSKGRMQ